MSRLQRRFLLPGSGGGAVLPRRCSTLGSRACCAPGLARAQHARSALHAVHGAQLYRTLLGAGTVVPTFSASLRRPRRGARRQGAHARRHAQLLPIVAATPRRGRCRPALVAAPTPWRSLYLLLLLPGATTSCSGRACTPCVARRARRRDRMAMAMTLRSHNMDRVSRPPPDFALTTEK